jgi:hypothetical protein
LADGKLIFCVGSFTLEREFEERLIRADCGELVVGELAVFVLRGLF